MTFWSVINRLGLVKTGKFCGSANIPIYQYHGVDIGEVFVTPCDGDESMTTFYFTVEYRLDCLKSVAQITSETDLDMFQFTVKELQARIRTLHP